MIIKKAQFIKSAADKSGFLLPDKPMIVICGKSNVGKSSFINMLANRKSLARTSNTPGRTRLINYFDFDNFILADLPGYGFAKVSREEKMKWAKTLDDFFAEEQYISHVLSLVDIRHTPTADDISMINYLHHYALPFTIIATKSDKLSKMEINKQLKIIGNYLAVGEKKIIAVSNEKFYGKEEILKLLDEIIEVAKNPFYDETEENDESEK